MYQILVVAGLIALGTALLPRVVLWHRLLYGTILPELVVFGSHKDRRRAFRLAEDDPGVSSTDC